MMEHQWKSRTSSNSRPEERLKIISSHLKHDGALNPHPFALGVPCSDQDSSEHHNGGYDPSVIVPRNRFYSPHIESRRQVFMMKIDFKYHSKGNNSEKYPMNLSFFHKYPKYLLFPQMSLMGTPQKTRGKENA